MDSQRWRRLWMEPLEDRRLLTSYLVDIAEDESDGNVSEGDLSLREAIESANATSEVDTIEFDTALVGKTITLTAGELTINDDLTISGPGADQLTISGNHASRIFSVNDAVSTQIFVEIRAFADRRPRFQRWGDFQRRAPYRRGLHAFWQLGRQLGWRDLQLLRRHTDRHAQHPG